MWGEEKVSDEFGEGMGLVFPRRVSGKALIVFLVCLAVFLFCVGVWVGSSVMLGECNDFVLKEYGGKNFFGADLYLKEGVGHVETE